jgi:hypothetical protein
MKSRIACTDEVSCLILVVVVTHVAARLYGRSWTAPRTGDAGQVEAGSGSTPAYGSHELSIQPGPRALLTSQDSYLSSDHSVSEAAGRSQMTHE